MAVHVVPVLEWHGTFERLDQRHLSAGSADPLRDFVRVRDGRRKADERYLGGASKMLSSQAVPRSGSAR